MIAGYRAWRVTGAVWTEVVAGGVGDQEGGGKEEEGGVDLYPRREGISERERIDGLGAHLLAAGNAPHLTWSHVTFVTVRFR